MTIYDHSLQMNNINPQTYMQTHSRPPPPTHLFSGKGWLDPFPSPGAMLRYFKKSLP